MQRIFSLDLSGTRITDLTSVGFLVQLESLRLTETLIEDLTPLASLIRLQRLSIKATQVADISPIASIAALRVLQLSRTNVQDLLPLEAAKNLNYLDISNTLVNNISSLRNSKISKLDMHGSAVTDLSPLLLMPKLTIFILPSSHVDLRPLLGLSGKWDLEGIDLQHSDLKFVVNSLSPTFLADRFEYLRFEKRLERPTKYL
jgi:Leucine-rich repeat (LRR) protein